MQAQNHCAVGVSIAQLLQGAAVLHQEESEPGSAALLRRYQQAW